MNYHIGRLVLSSLCVGALVWLVLGGVRFAGWSTITISARSMRLVLELRMRKVFLTYSKLHGIQKFDLRFCCIVR